MSKEIDDYRTRQEIEKAAALKAQLAQVKERNAPIHGRRPRKIGTIVVDSGIKTGYRNDTATFVLRLDDDQFIAEHGDTWYVSRSKEALVEKMKIVGRASLDLAWERYIVINYQALVSGKWDYDSELDVHESRKGKRVNGLRLRWEIVEYSSVFKIPGGDERYMKRANKDAQQESVAKLPDNMVAYTKEREMLLVSIQEAFASLDIKMRELLNGDAEKVARQLDALSGPPLLAMPAQRKR